MIKDRNWTVLLIGGASGTGKSTLAYEIAEFYKINVLEADDIYITMETVTAKDDFPAIHYWNTGIDWKSISVDGNINWLKNVSKEMSVVFKEIVNRHIEDKLPVIIEGDFISPEFASSFDNPDVQSLFLYESDKNQIIQNYLSREGGEAQDFRAEISCKYNDFLLAACKKYGIKTINSKPWTTVLERAIKNLM